MRGYHLGFFCHCQHSLSSRLWALRCSSVHFLAFWKSAKAQSANSIAGKHWNSSDQTTVGTQGENIVCACICVYDCPFFTAYSSITNICMHAVDCMLFLFASESVPLGIYTCKLMCVSLLPLLIMYACHVCICLHGYDSVHASVCVVCEKSTSSFKSIWHCPVPSLPLIYKLKQQAASRVNKCQVHSMCPLTGCWDCSVEGRDTYKGFFNTYHLCVPETCEDIKYHFHAFEQTTQKHMCIHLSVRSLDYIDVTMWDVSSEIFYCKAAATALKPLFHTSLPHCFMNIYLIKTVTVQTLTQQLTGIRLQRG